MKTKNFNPPIIEAMNKYDDTNYIYNAADDQIYTEKELTKKFSATDNYKLLKKVANQQEKKEFRDIERKYQKKKPTAQRTEPFIKVSNTRTPLNIDINPIPKFVSQQPTAKAFYNAGTKPKVSEGLAKILGVDND
jgi:type II secretory pathway component PulK|tara:strand:- start:25 stop:429 length:405 start_codon:yes stop_codon:yes gene_type:complete